MDCLGNPNLALECNVKSFSFMTQGPKLWLEGSLRSQSGVVNRMC